MKTISNKLIHEKIKVQSLQNDFVKYILSILWFNRIQFSEVSRRKNISHLWKIDIISFFFSTHTNIKAGYFNTKLLKIKFKYKNSLNIHIKKPIKLKIYKQIYIYKIKKNGFLTKINDNKYCKIFKIFNININIFYLTWNHWMTLNKNIAEPLQRIMKYVIL